MVTVSWEIDTSKVRSLPTETESDNEQKWSSNMIVSDVNGSISKYTVLSIITHPIRSFGFVNDQTTFS